MTRKEAIRRMECCRDFLANNYSDMGEPNVTAFNMAIKALEQESKLDKIRAEILAMMPPLGKWMYEEGHIEEQTTCEVIADVVQIIDKYKAESEEKK